MKLYKVTGPQGESIHGGSLTWSLPTGGAPGEWHEVTGPIVKCERGLHLTTEPARWWASDCRIWEAEAEGVEGEPDDSAKVVASRARLVSELTGDALHAVSVFASGQHGVAGACVAWGSARVEAYGSARVEAWGSSIVTIRYAHATPTVTLHGNAVCIDYRSGRPIVTMAREG